MTCGLGIPIRGHSVSMDFSQLRNFQYFCWSITSSYNPFHSAPVYTTLTRPMNSADVRSAWANYLFHKIGVLGSALQVVAIEFTPLTRALVKHLHNRDVCQPQKDTTVIPFPVPEPER